MAMSIDARLAELVAKTARHPLFESVTLAVATKDPASSGPAALASSDRTAKRD